MKKILAQHRSQICVWKKPSSLGLEIRQKWFRTSSVKICSRLDVFTLLDKLISPWSQTNVISFTCIKSHQNFTMVAVFYRRRLLANWSGRTFAESWQVWSLYQLIFVNFYPVKPNLYASGRHPDMNQTWHFVCSRKFKSWLAVAFLVVWFLKERYLISLAVLHFWFMSWYESFRILICPSRNAQQEILIFPLLTKSHIWFISGWRPDAYRFGLKYVCLHRNLNRIWVQRPYPLACLWKILPYHIYSKQYSASLNRSEHIPERQYSSFYQNAN